MPLKYFAATFTVNPNRLYLAPILLKLRKQIKKVKGIKSYIAIERRLLKAVINIDETASGGFTIFGMVLGEQSFLSHKDYEYIWDVMYEVFGESDEAFDFNKRSLGILLMWAFAVSDRNWIFDVDPDKEKKVLAGEIPDATKYFLDITGKSYALIKQVNNFSLEDLASKFNSRR